MKTTRTQVNASAFTPELTFGHWSNGNRFTNRLLGLGRASIGRLSGTTTLLRSLHRRRGIIVSLSITRTFLVGTVSLLLRVGSIEGIQGKSFLRGRRGSVLDRGPNTLSRSSQRLLAFKQLTSLASFAGGGLTRLALSAGRLLEGTSWLDQVRLDLRDQVVFVLILGAVCFAVKTLALVREITEAPKTHAAAEEAASSFWVIATSRPLKTSGTDIVNGDDRDEILREDGVERKWSIAKLLGMVRLRPRAPSSILS